MGVDSEPVLTPHDGDNMPLDNFTIRPSASCGPFAGAHSLAALLVSMNSSPGPHALIRCVPSFVYRQSDDDPSYTHSKARQHYRPRTTGAVAASLVLSVVPAATSSDGGARSFEMFRALNADKPGVVTKKMFSEKLHALVKSGAVVTAGNQLMRRYWRRA